MKLLVTILMMSCIAARIIFQEEAKDEDQPRTRGKAVTEKPFNTSTFCPDDLDWCDEPQDYPENIILKAVAKQKKTVKIMFDNEKVPKQESNTTSEVGVRIFEPEFENICDVETTYIKPRAAKNKEGKFMFIVNHPEGADEYIQLVRVATCVSAGEECGQGRLIFIFCFLLEYDPCCRIVHHQYCYQELHLSIVISLVWFLTPHVLCVDTTAYSALIPLLTLR
eukprot:TRINITY_DN4333_c0_g1_i3.p1 TRINITY_DN4333_c0_g1~~TRINITY_DN4333_c0_g1_i3.p1  ORF type:complete len:223 (-),score=50.31 TRINITY_DN4333_c0_g1_i3:126-794(-)